MPTKCLLRLMPLLETDAIAIVQDISKRKHAEEQVREQAALLDIARDMRELCPNAVLFNYANPMAMCCWALGRVPGLQFVGLCHGVQTTMDLIASYVGLPKDQIDYVAAGNK